VPPAVNDSSYIAFWRLGIYLHRLLIQRESLRRSASAITADAGITTDPLVDGTPDSLAGLLFQTIGETNEGNLPGGGLTVEISPVSFPNCSAVLGDVCRGESTQL
jgi:hypothetical protein